MAQKQTAKKNTPQSSKNSLILPALVAIAAVGFLAWTLMRGKGDPLQPPQAQVSAPAPVAASQPVESSMPQIPPDVAAASEADVAAVPRISVQEAKAKLDANEAVFVDVRDIESYAASHVPGSLHIPLVYIHGELEYLPKGKTLVTYCT